LEKENFHLPKVTKEDINATFITKATTFYFYNDQRFEHKTSCILLQHPEIITWSGTTMLAVSPTNMHVTRGQLNYMGLDGKI